MHSPLREARENAAAIRSRAIIGAEFLFEKWIAIPMRTSGWISRQSLILLLACALILPAIIAFAVGFSSTQNERRRTEEMGAVMAARQILQLTNSEVAANLRTLQMIGTTQVMATHGWREVEKFFDVARGANPEWQAMIVREAATGEVLLERGAIGSDGPLRELPRGWQGQDLAEGAYREGRYCPCVILHHRSRADPRLVLSLYLAPGKFQKILLQMVKRGTVAAIVDGNARFLARSLDYPARVGTSGTIYVRRAVARGGEGFYQGRTYEGLNNYTAYTTSPMTGWSAHVAVDRSLIDGRRARSIAAIALALSAGLVLAMALVGYAAHDARQRQRNERQLLELQKAEAIGQFTSIIVHDFRNILAVMWAGLSRLKRQTDDSAARQTVLAMEDALKRGDRLVNQLLSFARKENAIVGTVDLERLFEGVAELVQRTLGEGITFDWTVSGDARLATANADQLELALINLARNAKDAMAGQGAFSITTRKAGTMVEIAACDTGPGVTPNLRDRLFEPFFTTKDEAHGTGLGLAQVAGAVRQAGGHVEVDEAPGGGARFRLFLPEG